MNPSAVAIHPVVDNPLAKLELARRLLAETRSVDEVKMIRKGCRLVSGNLQVC